jgi:hypothetical protein
MRTRTDDLALSARARFARQLKTDEPDVNGIELRGRGKDQLEEGGTRSRLMRALRLGPASSAKGDTRTHAIEGADDNEVVRRAAAYGPKQARQSAEHRSASPSSYSESSSYSSVKVAAKKENARIDKITADPSTVSNYTGIFASLPKVLSVQTESLPDVPFPPNSSEQVTQELTVIKDTMDNAPLTDSVMDTADEEPLELFKRACEALGVPVDDEIAPMLVDDLRKIALELKYRYMRPRPYAIAPYHDITIVMEDTHPYDDTPSYPSVNALIGYGLAELYAGLYPFAAEQFYNVADTVAVQRIQSGRHYPSDNEYARIIAKTLMGAE